MRECSTIVSENGRIIIPVLFRKELGIKPGDELILSLSVDNDIIVHSPKQSLQKLQDIVSAKRRKKSLADELIQMRRKEKI
jgi:AbrB family looped-hinge helix DNA binding protein